MCRSSSTSGFQKPTSCTTSPRSTSDRQLYRRDTPSSGSCSKLRQIFQMQHSRTRPPSAYPPALVKSPPPSLCWHTHQSFVNRKLRRPTYCSVIYLHDRAGGSLFERDGLTDKPLFLTACLYFVWVTLDRSVSLSFMLSLKSSRVLCFFFMTVDDDWSMIYPTDEEKHGLYQHFLYYMSNQKPDPQLHH